MNKDELLERIATLKKDINTLIYDFSVEVDSLFEVEEEDAELWIHS